MIFYLADRQDITRAGLIYIIESLSGDKGSHEVRYTEDKGSLIQALREQEEAVVVVDYTLFDINDASELAIICERFPKARWILFSEDLSVDFVRSILLTCHDCGIVLKECAMTEIRESLRFAMSGVRYICQQITEQLVTPEKKVENELPKLTKTETEILRDIALGMTTKEIAEKRFSSFHTVNTHRKNIFRKLDVNNIHEATKYAMRAGLIDAAEYCI